VGAGLGEEIGDLADQLGPGEIEQIIVAALVAVKRETAAIIELAQTARLDLRSIGAILDENALGGIGPKLFGAAHWSYPSASPRAYGRSHKPAPPDSACRSGIGGLRQRKAGRIIPWRRSPRQVAVQQGGRPAPRTTGRATSERRCHSSPPSGRPRQNWLRA